MTVSIDPVIFTWQGFALRWYPLIVILSIAVATLVSRKEAARHGLPAAYIGDLLLWVIPSGLLGARLFHGLDNWDRYAANLLQLLAIDEGGLAIYGALIAGGIATAVYTRRLGRLACIISILSTNCFGTAPYSSSRGICAIVWTGWTGLVCCFCRPLACMPLGDSC